MRARFADTEALPSVDDTKARVASRMTDKLKAYLHDVDSGYRRLSPSVDYKRQQMLERHRTERDSEMQRISEREKREAQMRATRLPSGFTGIWSRITGRFSKIKERNEMEALAAWERDRAEKDRFVARQLDERQRLQQTVRKMREDRAKELAEINREIAAYVTMKRGDVPNLSAIKRPNLDQTQDRKRMDVEKARQQIERTRERNRRRDRSRNRDRPSGDQEPEI